MNDIIYQNIILIYNVKVDFRLRIPAVSTTIPVIPKKWSACSGYGGRQAPDSVDISPEYVAL